MGKFSELAKASAKQSIERFRDENGGGGKIVEIDNGLTGHYEWRAPDGRLGAIAWEVTQVQEDAYRG